MVYLLFLCLLTGIASAIAMSNKGRSGVVGFLLGFFLGPIGLVIVLVVKPDSAALDARGVAAGVIRKCPACAEMVKLEAIKCKHCGADLPPMTAPTAHGKTYGEPPVGKVEKAAFVAVITVIVIAAIAAKA